jgi:hypothetical protein
MATMTSVKNWLCKCGRSLQVVAEIDSSQSTSETVKCPNCGREEKIVSAYRIVSVRQQKAEWEADYSDKKAPPE